MLNRLVLTAFCLCAAPFARAETIVFAASSLKEPLDALAADLGEVTLSYGGSGTLARQVSLGAPADLILLANAEWIDVLRESGHIGPDAVDFASNELVLIGPAGGADVPLTAAGMQDALQGGRIATGLTNAVPAGIYAKAALTSLGLWDVLSGQLAEVDNVRAALALVARGQAPLGIVYASDARVSDAVRIVARFPADSHPPIRYLAALTSNAGPEAAGFLDLLTGPKGQSALAQAGFLPPVQATE